MKLRSIPIAVAGLIAVPLFVLPASAEWRSAWKTKWAVVNNTGYLIPYFPGKRLVSGVFYFIQPADDSLNSDGSPNAETGECSEG